MDTRWFDCSCSSAHHAIRVTYEPEYNEVFFEMRVNNYKSFWRRLVAAYKYLFNCDNKNASYDTFILSPDDRKIVVATINRMKDE